MTAGPELGKKFGQEDSESIQLSTDNQVVLGQGEVSEIETDNPNKDEYRVSFKKGKSIYSDGSNGSDNPNPFEGFTPEGKLTGKTKPEPDSSDDTDFIVEQDLDELKQDIEDLRTEVDTVELQMAKRIHIPITLGSGVSLLLAGALLLSVGQWVIGALVVLLSLFALFVAKELLNDHQIPLIEAV